MNLIIGLMISALMFMQTAGAGGDTTNTSISSSRQNDISTICLTDSTAQNGISQGNLRVPAVLQKINKATSENTTQGYEIAKCQGQGSCGDVPSVADYRLVATGVKISHVIYPNNFTGSLASSDRQLVKQLDITSDPILADRYKNRVYRTFCGDWCYTCPPDKVQCSDPEGLNCVCTTSDSVTLPYRGSFHCNFIFYLEDFDSKGNRQIDEYGNLASDHQNPNDEQLPADNSLFSVYFREGATLPDNIRCKDNPQTNLFKTVAPEKASRGILQEVQGDISFLISKSKILAQKFSGSFDLASTQGNRGFIGKVRAQNYGGPTLIYPPDSGTYWLFESNTGSSTGGAFRARNTEITTDKMVPYNNPKTGSNLVSNPMGLNGTYAVYKNVLDPASDNFIYLLPQGVMEQMLSGLSNSSSLRIELFDYYLFSALGTTSGSQKSLKLGKFKPIISQNWISKWAQESKPAIYIYPTQKENINVKLGTKGVITISDPPYIPESGWNVTAYKGGRLETRTGKSYPYLYYEANLAKVKIENTGKVVQIDGLKKYIQKELTDLGLNDKETDDFLGYWLPRLEGVKAPYFFIHFLDANQIDELEPMQVSTPVDTSIRIRVYFKPLDYPLSVKPQDLQAASQLRKGLTVVEWGGILDSE
ncbi:hypothetical protein M1271_06665 [Patescibacteria group bacterium]|nr:hypothetical protein [Patescibacteria group bacterium]